MKRYTNYVLTTRQKCAIIDMRFRGYSYQEIAEQFGVTKQSIWELYQRRIQSEKHAKKAAKRRASRVKRKK